MMPINEPSWGSAAAAADHGFQQASSTLLGMNPEMSERAKQIFNRENFRSVADFFGGFTVLLSPPQLMDRARHNVRYYYLNYMALTAIVFCATLLFSPSSIIGLGILAAMWVGVSRLDVSMNTQRIATGALGIFSLFVLYYLLSGVFWLALYSSTFLSICHIIFRDNTNNNSDNTHGDYSSNYQYSTPGDAIVGQL